MRNQTGKIFAVIFLCVGLGVTPFLFLNVIQPRLGILSANISVGSLHISSVTDQSVTFKLGLNVANPTKAPISVPLLNFSAYLGGVYLGHGWTTQEVTVPVGGQQSVSTFLNMSRTQGSPLFDLFQAFLDGTSVSLTLQGNAFVGGLAIPFQMTMPLGGSSGNSGAKTAVTGGTGSTGSGNIATDFINYIQANGVDLSQLFNVVTLNATNFLEFLNKYQIDFFGILYFLQQGQEWWNGFEQTSLPTSFTGSWNVPYMARPGVQDEVNKINNNYTYGDANLAGNLDKVLWDLDEPSTFLGTPYSRVDGNAYTQDYLYNTTSKYDTTVTMNFTYDEARYPAKMVDSNPKVWNETFYLTFNDYNTISEVASNYGYPFSTQALTTPIAPPMFDGNDYSNNTDTVWNVTAWENFSASLSADNYTSVNYMRFAFKNASGRPFLDIQGDGNPLTFNNDYLAFYDNNVYNAGNPNASLLAMYDEDNNLIWYSPDTLWGENAKTPWFETNNIRIEFKSNNHTAPHSGFQIVSVDLWHDAQFEDIPAGNFTPWTTMDTHPLQANHRQFFNASALAEFDLWQSTIWNKIHVTPPQPQFSSKGSSLWDTLWWLQYNYDFRAFLDLFGRNETALIEWLNQYVIQPGNTQGGQLTQIALMYGELPLPNGTLLKDAPGWPTMSPLHYQMDFMTGGPFSAMISPMQQVWIYEKNATGGYDHKLVDYQSRYGVPDAPDGAGGPYGADVAYMSQLLFNDPSSGFVADNSTLSAMSNLAMTQDSRDPNSVWQMMNRIQMQKLGTVQMDMTFANTQPLNLIDVVNALSQVPSTGTRTSGGNAPHTSTFSVTSLLGGVDMMQFLNYIENHTNSSLGTVLRSLQVSTYAMLTYIIENVHPDPADATISFPIVTPGVGIFSTPIFAAISLPGMVFGKIQTIATSDSYLMRRPVL